MFCSRYFCPVGVFTAELECGRLESDFRYSKDIVYNNYPFPLNHSDKQKQAVVNAAQNVLDIRAMCFLTVV